VADGRGTSAAVDEQVTPKTIVPVMLRSQEK